MMNYYDLLGVSKDATVEEIRKAYKRNIRYYHPDVNKSDNAEEMSKALNNARDILTDPVKRKEYDDQLKQMEELRRQGYTNRRNQYTNNEKNAKADDSHYRSYQSNDKTHQSNDEKHERDYKTHHREYEYISKSKAVMMWLRYSKRNIFIKTLGCLIICISWLFHKFIELIEIPLIMGTSIIESLCFFWSFIGTVILILNFIFSLGFFEDFHPSIIGYLIFLVTFYLPSLLAMKVEEWLPYMVIAIDDFETWLIVKIINF